MTTKMMMNILNVLMATAIAVCSVNATVCNTENMTSVSCSDRNITSANVTGTRSQVKSLYLNNNRITSLPEGVFDKLVTLQHLLLHNNQIASLAEGIFDELVNLQRLFLHLNQITSLPGSVFNKLVNLRNLYLNENQITSLPVGVLNKLVNLQHLLLDQNQITSLPGGVFDKLANLQSLYLGNNQITSLPLGVFNKLVKLTQLDLNGNSATTIDCEFIQCRPISLLGEYCFGKKLMEYCRQSHCQVPADSGLVGAGTGKTNSSGTYYRFATPSCPFGHSDCAPKYVTACSIDINECLLSSSCDASISTCSNTNGSYRCDCNSFNGYEQVNGITCADIDECLVNNSCNANISTCNNSIGSYHCDCFDGYKQVNNFTCTDINECASSPCLNNGTCFNNLNNFNCSCADGFNGMTCSDSSSGSSLTSNTVNVLISLLVYFNVSPILWFLWT